MLAISRPKIEGSGVLLLLETQNIMGDTEIYMVENPFLFA